MCHMLLPCTFSTCSLSQGEAVVKQGNANPAHCALSQPLNWQLDGIMPVCFPEPFAWGATFLIIYRRSLLAASFLSPPLLWP